MEKWPDDKDAAIENLKRGNDFFTKAKERKRARDKDGYEFYLSMALQSYGTALCLYPKSALLHFNVGLTFNQLGDREIAAAYIVRSIQLSPWSEKWTDPEVLYCEFGLCYAYRKKRAEARMIWKEGLAKYPEFAALWDSLSVTYLEEENFTECAYYTSIVMKLGTIQADQVKNTKARYAMAMQRLTPDEKRELEQRLAGVDAMLADMKKKSDAARKAGTQYLTKEFEEFVTNFAMAAGAKQQLYADLWGPAETKRPRKRTVRPVDEGTKNPEESIRVFEAVSPSVVTIRNLEGSATGIVLDTSGLILTNAHVVSTPLPVEVHLEGGTVVRSITVVGIHPRYDLALIRIDAAAKGIALKAVVLASKPAKPGQRVYAIGSPDVDGMVLTKTVSGGILGAVGRPVKRLPYYQFSAQINDGNAGGPLCNRDGRVIGLVVFRFDEVEGIGLAIPLHEFTADVFIPISEREKDAELAEEYLQECGRYNARRKTVTGDNQEGRLLLRRSMMCAKTAMFLAPNDPVQYFNVGMMWEDAGRPEVAVAYFLKSIEISPWTSSQYPYHRLGMCLVNQKKYEEAGWAWMEAGAKYPDQHLAWVNLGGNWMERGDAYQAAWYCVFALAVGQKRMSVPQRGATQNRIRNLIRELKPEEKEKLNVEVRTIPSLVGEMRKTAKKAEKEKRPFLTAEFREFIRTYSASLGGGPDGGDSATAVGTPVKMRPFTEDELWGKPKAGFGSTGGDPAAKQWITRKLGMARTYHSNRMNSKAIGVLKEIIKKYPDEPATAEVRKLLQEWGGR